jgi:hypothetical protein
MNEELEAVPGQPTETRMDAQRKLVKRMASIATRLVPDGHGAHLRFINEPSSNLDNLTQDQINDKMQFKPRGGTAIGTQLEQRILKPLVYDVLDKGDTLERPYLILTITDGDPNPEPKETFKNAIVDCGKRLAEREYQQECKNKHSEFE